MFNNNYNSDSSFHTHTHTFSVALFSSSILYFSGTGGCLGRGQGRVGVRTADLFRYIEITRQDLLFFPIRRASDN